jgi:hypothetical protein
MRWAALSFVPRPRRARRLARAIRLTAASGFLTIRLLDGFDEFVRGHGGASGDVEACGRREFEIAGSDERRQER